MHKGIKKSLTEGMLNFGRGPSLCRFRYRQKISGLADGVFICSVCVIRGFLKRGPGSCYLGL